MVRRFISMIIDVFNILKRAKHEHISVGVSARMAPDGAVASGWIINRGDTAWGFSRTGEYLRIADGKIIALKKCDVFVSAMVRCTVNAIVGEDYMCQWKGLDANGNAKYSGVRHWFKMVSGGSDDSSNTMMGEIVSLEAGQELTLYVENSNTQYDQPLHIDASLIVM